MFPERDVFAEISGADTIAFTGQLFILLFVVVTGCSGWMKVEMAIAEAVVFARRLLGIGTVTMIGKLPPRQPEIDGRLPLSRQGNIRFGD